MQASIIAALRQTNKNRNFVVGNDVASVDDLGHAVPGFGYTVDMEFKQFYLGCLSHASYYLGSGGEAVIIDPQRDVDQNIEYAGD